MKFSHVTRQLQCGGRCALTVAFLLGAVVRDVLHDEASFIVSFLLTVLSGLP